MVAVIVLSITHSRKFRITNEKVLIDLTKLRCTAVHCEHNSDNHCCLSDVKIGGGERASSACETCCDSFKERSSNPTNKADAYRFPEDRVGVRCTATSCHYNSHGDCHANAVKIGNATAYRHCDTECHTFMKKCKNC